MGGLLVPPLKLSSATTVSFRSTAITTLATNTGGLIFSGMTSRQATSPINNPPYAIVNDEAITNLVPNPSFEVDTTGWSASGANASISRVTSEKYIGDACLQVVVSPAANTQGVVSSAITVSGNTVYVVSLWVKSAAVDSFNLVLTGNNSGASSATYATSTGWRRVTMTKTTSAGDTTLTITVRTGSAIAVTWYLDGVQLEASTDPSDSAPTPTSYCDGSLGVGHAWTGTAHNSSSTRAAGEHHLAPITAGSQNAVVVKPDGTQVGFRKKHRLEGYVSGGATETASSYLWSLEGEKLTVGRVGSNEALAFINNKTDGISLWVKSQATAEFAMIVEGPSITTGAIFAVAAPSDLSNFSGSFLRFFDKSNSDTYAVKRDSMTYGNQALGWDKSVYWYAGGKYTYTSGANLTGTVTCTATTTVTGSGTSFTTELSVGDIITFTGSSSRGTVEAIASNTSLTLVAAGPTVTAVNFQKLSTRYGAQKHFLEGPNGDHIGIGKSDVTSCMFVTGSDTYRILPTAFTAGAGTLQIVSGSGTVTLGTADATIAVGDWIHIPGQTSLAAGHPPLQVIRKASNTSLRVRPAASASFTTASGAWFYQRANQVTAPTADSQGFGVNYNYAQDFTAAGPSASTSEVSLFSSGNAPYIRASSLSTNRAIKVVLYGTLSGAGATKTLTIRVKLGVTTILTTHAETIADTTTNNFKMEVIIAANNAENAQYNSLELVCKPATDGAAVETIIDYETSSVQTDADQQLDITAQFGTSNGTMTANYKIVELI
jgi:hypothetical protein